MNDASDWTAALETARGWIERYNDHPGRIGAGMLNAARCIVAAHEERERLTAEKDKLNAQIRHIEKAATRRALVRLAIDNAEDERKERMDTHEQPSPVFDFGSALAHLRAGDRIRRSGWNGKGMYVSMVTPADFDPATEHVIAVQRVVDWEGNPRREQTQPTITQPFAFLFTAQGDRIPWNASQADLFAIDWEVAT